MMATFRFMSLINLIVVERPMPQIITKMALSDWSNMAVFYILKRLFSNTITNCSIYEPDLLGLAEITFTALLGNQVDFWEGLTQTVANLNMKHRH